MRLWAEYLEAREEYERERSKHKATIEWTESGEPSGGSSEVYSEEVRRELDRLAEHAHTKLKAWAKAWRESHITNTMTGVDD